MVSRRKMDVYLCLGNVQALSEQLLCCSGHPRALPCVV